MKGWPPPLVKSDALKMPPPEMRTPATPVNERGALDDEGADGDAKKARASAGAPGKGTRRRR